MTVDELKQNYDFLVIHNRFPHIGLRITYVWGYREFLDYTNKLFTDTRGGTRQGFPDDVATSLFSLMQLHDSVFPELKDAVPSTDTWTTSGVWTTTKNDRL